MKETAPWRVVAKDGRWHVKRRREASLIFMASTWLMFVSDARSKQGGSDDVGHWSLVTASGVNYLFVS